MPCLFVCLHTSSVHVCLCSVPCKNDNSPKYSMWSCSPKYSICSYVPKHILVHAVCGCV